VYICNPLLTSLCVQVASGRFGVTPAYLMSAEQIEIKIAQVRPYVCVCVYIYIFFF